MVVDATFVTSAHNITQCPEHDFPEIIILGRSNVGKSTFLNRLISRKNFVRVSQKPGKTQTLNFFEVNEKMMIVDAPGYGYAKVSKKMRQDFGKMIENYLQKRHNLKQAVLLVDFKVGPTEDDVLMYEYLRYYNIPLLVIATKKDKIPKTKRQSQIDKIYQTFNQLSLDDFFCYSANDPVDVEKIKEIVFTKNVYL